MQMAKKDMRFLTLPVQSSQPQQPIHTNANEKTF
jgi:hypothetical protein